MYETALEIMKKMSPITYGWVDKDGNKHFDDGKYMYDGVFILQTPKQLLESRAGVCWDQVELERKLFADQDIKTKTFFIGYYGGKQRPTHTFLTFREGSTYYWFEHSWQIHQGIHKYPTQESLLNDVRKKFIDGGSSSGKLLVKNETDIKLFRYKKPKFGISTEAFFRHCQSGDII